MARLDRDRREQRPAHPRILRVSDPEAASASRGRRVFGPHLRLVSSRDDGRQRSAARFRSGLRNRPGVQKRRHASRLLLSFDVRAIIGRLRPDGIASGTQPELSHGFRARREPQSCEVSGPIRGGAQDPPLFELASHRPRLRRLGRKPERRAKGSRALPVASADLLG